MAEAFLRRRLDDLAIQGRVHSAGLIMNRQLLAGADLLVGMAREHVREAVLAAPEVWPRAFTLKELVRRGEEAGPRGPGESLESWLARAHGDRAKADLLGQSDDDDIYDPLGESKDTYARTAEEISGLVDRLVDLAWPAAARESAGVRS